MTKFIVWGALLGVMVGAPRADAGQFEKSAPPSVEAEVERAIEVAMQKAEVDLQRFEVAMQHMALAAQAPQPPQPPLAQRPPLPPLPPEPFIREAQSDRLYRQGREQIDAGRYDSAVQIFDRLVGQESERADND